MKKNRPQKKSWLDQIEGSYRDLTPDRNPETKGYDSKKYFKYFAKGSKNLASVKDNSFFGENW